MGAAAIDKRTECANCTFVKTILMLVVVFHHSILFWTGSWYTANPVFRSDVLAFMANWTGTFHVCGFTLVSGYLFYFLKEENGKYTHFGAFVLNKAKRLLIPYLFVAVLWVIPVYYTYKEFSVVSIVQKYLLGTSPSQLWFLLMLFNVFLLMWPFSRLLAKHHAGAIFFGLVLYGVGWIGEKIIPNYFQIMTSCKYVIFFVIGFKLRQIGTKAIMKLPWFIWIFLSVAFFGVSQVLADSESLIGKSLSVGVNFICNIVGVLMAFAVLQKVAVWSKWQDRKLLKKLTQYAMPIYLFHQQIVFLFINLLNGVIEPHLHALINFAGAMVLSVVLSALLMKFRWTRFLIGEK